MVHTKEKPNLLLYSLYYA